MSETPETLDSLFEESLLKDDDVQSVVDDDLNDSLLEQLEENRKISIFDSEFVLEGEM